MRSVILCLVGAVAALAFTEIASDGHGTALSPPQAVERGGKSDPLAERRPAAPEHAVATVEVVGLEPAAIVFRDRNGSILFRTDPAENITVVVRGVALPQVTLRQSTDAPVKPLSIDAPRTDDDSAGREQPAEALPDGCEPAASALSPLGSSMIGARCHASLSAPLVSVASLDNAASSQ